MSRPIRTLLMLALALVLLLCHNTQLAACSLNPTANITNSPSGSIFYAHTDTEIELSGATSLPNCGVINQYRWSIDGVIVSWSMVYNHIFVLPSGQDQKSYSVELRVRNSAGNYHTRTRTIYLNRLKSFYYLTDHLGSVRVTVNEAGDPVGWDDYYPFGLQMPGRNYNASNAHDDQKFTGYELEQQGDLGLYHAGARMYDPEIGRFMSQDPLGAKYPGISPFVYALNNPLVFVDPDGREARCASEADCQRKAQELNEIHDNETNITVVEAEWEESVASENRFLRALGLGKTTRTVSGFKLSTQESSFDFGQHEITSALYDVINSDEFNFYFEFVPGEFELTGHPTRVTAYEAQGRIYPRIGGGGVRVSADGNEMNVPTGVVIMHELIGHGHPNSIEANDINRFYGAPFGNDHGGYHKIINWPISKTGLYQKRR